MKYETYLKDKKISNLDIEDVEVSEKNELELMDGISAFSQLT